MNYGYYPLLTLCLIAACLAVYRRAGLKRSESKLPHPEQGPLSQRFLVEPFPPQVEAWAREIPHNGLLEYYGILGQKRVLVTDPRAIHDMFQTHAYSYVKSPAVSKLLKSVLGEGLVVAEGDQHRLCMLLFFDRRMAPGS